MTPSLESAIALAAMAHQGQKDKNGEPYILHPLRVMLAQDNDKAAMAAVLHDVPEDCPFLPVTTLWQMGYPAEVIDALEALTKRRNEPYMDYLARCCKNEIAWVVKHADLMDNLDPERYGNPMSPEEIERHKKYESALTAIMNADNGVMDADKA